MKLRRCILFMLFALLSTGFGLIQPNPEPAMANGGVLAAFENAYPNSATKDASCQVCHVSDSGGEPWNAYGWSVRQGVVDNGLSSAAAFAAIEMLDADGNGISNIDEINGNAAPGWTMGNVHTSYFKDGSTSVDQAPPTLSISLDVTTTQPMTDTEPMTGTTPIPMPPITSTVPYDEASDGDLSGNPLVPNLFTLGEGSNVITATSVQGDREYFTIIVPEGMTLDSIVLESYTSDSEQSFIGIQSGATFTEPFTNAVASNLLGYVLFGMDPAVGTDILDNMGAASDAMGFTGPLPEGTYAFWSQETSANPATYRLNFVIAGNYKVYLPVVYNVATATPE